MTLNLPDIKTAVQEHYEKHYTSKTENLDKMCKSWKIQLTNSGKLKYRYSE